MYIPRTNLSLRIGLWTGDTVHICRPSGMTRRPPQPDIPERNARHNRSAAATSARRWHEDTARSPQLAAPQPTKSSASQLQSIPPNPLKNFMTEELQDAGRDAKASFEKKKKRTEPADLVHVPGSHQYFYRAALVAPWTPVWLRSVFGKPSGLTSPPKLLWPRHLPPNCEGGFAHSECESHSALPVGRPGPCAPIYWRTMFGLSFQKTPSFQRQDLWSTSCHAY